MLYILENNARIEKTATGLHFYEQDVVCCRYKFGGSIRFSFTFNYITAGIGLVMGDVSGDSLLKSKRTFLFKFGYNDFAVYKRVFGSQTLEKRETTILAPKFPVNDVTIRGTIAKQTIHFEYVLINYRGEEEVYPLGDYTLDEPMPSYYLGLYSNANNTLQQFTIKQAIPKYWVLSINNVRGGRTEFIKNGFIFENCRHDAELEGYSVRLDAGTYYVGYEKEDVDGYNDVECFIFPVDSIDRLEEATIHDEHKSILDPKTNSFVMKEAGMVNIKFRGTSGQIKNIFITDVPNGSFVSTKDESRMIDGSSITVKRKGLKKLTADIIVHEVPAYLDLSKPAPYAMVKTKTQTKLLNDLQMVLNKRYRITYTTKNNLLEVLDINSNRIVKVTVVALTEDDNNRFLLFKNIRASVSSLILEAEDGNTTNVIVQKTFKKYVPSTIISPIIVTDTDNNSFDLSASYREVVKPISKVAVYKTSAEIRVPEELPSNASYIRVYGIPKDTPISLGKSTIEETAPRFAELTNDKVRREKHIIIPTDAVKELYSHIAVVYTSVEDYQYLFTNYEREYFDGTDSLFALEHVPSELNKNVIVYGIPHNAFVNDNYFYRVPSSSLLNSLDYYTDTYEVLSEELYDIDFEGHFISLHDNYSDKYKSYVVDYLKANSYAVNYIDAIAQYEVDIATDNKEVIILYDMHGDGSIYEYMRTDIVPSTDKYIVLSKDE